MNVCRQILTGDCCMLYLKKDGQPVPDYHTNLVDENGNRKDGVPGEGYWAVTKQFYTMMQYSK